MGTPVVVIESPLIKHPASFLETEEELAVECLVAKAAVETFYVAVPPRAAFSNRECLNLGLAQPSLNFLGYELGAIIAANLAEALACLTRADVARLTPSERSRLVALLTGESIEDNTTDARSRDNGTDEMLLD